MGLTAASEAILRLFPHFQEPCIITTASLFDNKSTELDLEDEVAAQVIFDCISDIQGNSANVEIKGIQSGFMRGNKHLIAIGGGWTNKANEYVMDIHPIDYKRPFLSLSIKPNLGSHRMAKRIYDWKIKQRPLGDILDKSSGRDEIIPGVIDSGGWLIKDYLLITTIYLKDWAGLVSEEIMKKIGRPISDNTLITTFAGVSGPGTMATELFFKGIVESEKEITKIKGINPCFQSLYVVEGISRTERLAYPKKIKSDRIYPVMDLSTELVSKNNSILTGVSQTLKQTIQLETSVKIDFYDSEIPTITPPEIMKEVITSDRESSPQIFSLLKYHLEHHYRQKGGIHWMEGFVLFSAWNKGEGNGEDEKVGMDYLGLFTGVHSFLKSLGKKTQLWIIKIRKGGRGDRYNKGHWTLEDVKFSSNIFEAREYYEKAQGLKEAGKLTKAKETIIEACKIYLDYLKGHLFLFECYKKEGFKGTDKKTTQETIKEMLSFFEKKSTKYRRAYKTIQNMLNKTGEDRWKNPMAEEIKKMRDRIEAAEIILRKLCLDQHIFTPDEEAWEKFKHLIIAAVDGDNKNSSEFNELVTRREIKKILVSVKFDILEKFRNYVEDIDVYVDEGQILDCFWEEMKKIEIANFPSSAHFRKYFKIALLYAVKNEVSKAIKAKQEEEKAIKEKSILSDDQS